MTDTDKKITPAGVEMPDPTFSETLPAGAELRINAIETHIKVLVGEGGLSEVFGRELPVNEPVFFHHGEKIAIFCWRHTKITISGACDPYQSTGKTMDFYLNL